MSMSKAEIKKFIEEGRAALGIELGSTRIKSVLIGEDFAPLASGSCIWENRYEDGNWTYHLDDVWAGLQESYAALASDVSEQYGLPLRGVAAIGISAMMHGYLAFDTDGELLVPFRTWRNVRTQVAAQKLTDWFGFNIPQRWSIAHLYQALIDEEPHTKNIAFITTLAGYVHWKLTGEKVLGIGDASGMFPIDADAWDYDAKMLTRFDAEIKQRELSWKLRDILPRVLVAGEAAGRLTPEGATLLDSSGRLVPDIPLCPPEGDAGTGMIATDSISVRTGNISAGTSIFAMVVLESGLAKVHPEIDIVTTPAGKPVAMVHCNNCTSEIDAWAGIFREFAEAAGAKLDTNDIYEILYRESMDADPDCGGLLVYNYHSGEPITGLDEGRPLLVRTNESRFTLANVMRAQLYSAIATLKIGMGILEDEAVRVDKFVGHGGLFKQAEVGQRFMASALGTPVSVMETAGEGGSWGIALLAAFRAHRKPGQDLEDFIRTDVFSTMKGSSISPDADTFAGFESFMLRYSKGLAIERAAVEHL